MSAAQQRERSQRMAADLAARGIYHGKRTTTPRHNNIPVDAAGSAAYRRMKKQGKS